MHSNPFKILNLIKVGNCLLNINKTVDQNKHFFICTVLLTILFSVSENYATAQSLSGFCSNKSEIAESLLQLKQSNAISSENKTKEAELSLNQKNKIQKIFSEIKKLTLSFVESKKSRTTEEFYQKIIQQVHSSQLIFDPNLTDFNAITKPSQIEKPNEPHSFEIHIGALAKLIDTHPETLFFLLAHEMGHIVGPSYFYHQSFLFNKAPKFNEYSVYYPLHEIVMCAKKVSLLPDLECLNESTSQLNPIFFSNLIQNIKSTVNKLSLNPYVSTILFQSSQRNCQLGQIEESFADTFAAEILYQHYLKKNAHRPISLRKKVELEKYLAFLCAHERIENIIGYNDNSTYLKSSDRIEKNILSHYGLNKISSQKKSNSVCEF